jgi:hypothetical protein
MNTCFVNSVTPTFTYKIILQTTFSFLTSYSIAIARKVYSRHTNHVFPSIMPDCYDYPRWLNFKIDLCSPFTFHPHKNFILEIKFISWHIDLDNVIWKFLYPAMNEASLVKLCLPDPPTPTSRAWPRGVRITREIFTKFVMASYSYTKVRHKN